VPESRHAPEALAEYLLDVARPEIQEDQDVRVLRDRRIALYFPGGNLE